jgi:hypothetical protein
LKGHPNWGSKKRSAEIWDAFDECAHMSTGEPAMACKACHKVFCHPSIRAKGNSLFENHMTSTCTIRSREGQAAQLLLTDIVSKVTHLFSCLSSALTSSIAEAGQQSSLF